MKDYKLFKTETHDLLFEGQFASFRACLEQAVLERINLAGIDLSHQNLMNCNLDDAIMPGACFDHANLSGVNLSDSYMKGAQFKNASLYNACLCFSNLTACDFEDTAFGATDISGSILTKSRFSTLSCFSLNFSMVKNMHGCLFLGAGGGVSSMSVPPIVIHGLDCQPIILMDHDVRRGRNVLDYDRLRPLLQRLSERGVMPRFERSLLGEAVGEK